MSPEGFETGKMYELSIENIVLPTTQTRQFFDPTAMEELQASIQRYGVLQPVIVTSGEGDKFILVSGERRYQACVAVSRPTIPAIVTDGNPEEITIVENLLREDLTAIEEAEAINALKTAHKYPLFELCSILGKSDASLSAILSLNKLPVKVKDECRKNPTVSRAVLVEIAKLHSVDEMQALYDKYKESGISRDDIRSSQRRSKKPDNPADFAFVATCTGRLQRLDLAKIDPGQLATLIQDLENLRSEAFKKLKALRAEPAQQG